METEASQEQRFTVNVFEADDVGGVLIFTFVPKVLQREHGPNGIPKRVPQFIVAVRPAPSGLAAFDWSESSDDPGAARAEIETEIAARIKDRETWINRVTCLVGQVEQWAKELGWSTRRIEKKVG